jgi:hypothetical protein
MVSLGTRDERDHKDFHACVEQGEVNESDLSGSAVDEKFNSMNDGTIP